MAQTQQAAVRQGLADRAKPKTAQSTGGGGGRGRIDPDRFQNPNAARQSKLAHGGLDYGRFQNPNAARQSVGNLHPQFAAGAGTPPAAPAAPQSRGLGPPQVAQRATMPVPAQYQAPPRPPGRFGQWTPRTAQQAVPPQYQTPPRPAAPIVAQPMGQAVPGQYQTPGRPMVPMQPQVAQAAPMPMAPQVMAETPQQEVARLQHRIAQLMGPQMYNPTPYTGR